jgi:hypothetical protein
MRVLRVCTAILSCLSGTGATRLCLLAFLLATAVTGSGFFRSLAQSPAQLSGSFPAAAQAQTAVKAPVSAQAVATAQPVMQPVANAAPAGPQQQIAQLLQMATDLKSAVDKTNKDELSITVVRKASAIEQLARKVRSAWPANDR